MSSSQATIAAIKETIPLYPMVADALITAMKDVLGDAFTEGRKTAWTEAYTFLAEFLMQRGHELYEQQ